MDRLGQRELNRHGATEANSEQGARDSHADGRALSLCRLDICVANAGVLPLDFDEGYVPKRIQEEAHEKRGEKRKSTRSTQPYPTLPLQQRERLATPICFANASHSGYLISGGAEIFGNTGSGILHGSSVNLESSTAAFHNKKGFTTAKNGSKP